LLPAGGEKAFAAAHGAKLLAGQAAEAPAILGANVGQLMLLEIGPDVFGRIQLRRVGRRRRFCKARSCTARSWATGICGHGKRSSMDCRQPPGRRWRQMAMNRCSQLPTALGTPSGNPPKPETPQHAGIQARIPLPWIHGTRTKSVGVCGGEVHKLSL
jgi:hypothetical protein